MFSSNSSSDHDNWYAPAINESLAFYMSTNTFNNPIFEAQFELDSSQEGEIVSGGSGCTEQNEVGRNQEELSRSSKSSSPSTTCKVSNGNNNIKQEQKQNNWTNFCDNLMFSIKSKIYVFELNFKRKLQRLRRFASGHLPSWLMTNIGSIKNHATAAATTTSSGENIYVYENYDDMNDDEEEEEEDKFWETIQQPYSKDSLNVQQEKILSRLEQVIQAKRSNSFHGFLEQQQQQQGELFNIAQSELSSRLRLNCSSDGLRGSSSKQANNNGNGGAKFKAGFNQVLNTAGICSTKLKVGFIRDLSHQEGRGISRELIESHIQKYMFVYVNANVNVRVVVSLCCVLVYLTVKLATN